MRLVLLGCVVLLQVKRSHKENVSGALAVESRQRRSHESASFVVVSDTDIEALENWHCLASLADRASWIVEQNYILSGGNKLLL